METPKTALLGRTLDEIQQIVRNLGMPKFAAKQIRLGCMIKRWKR